MPEPKILRQAIAEWALRIDAKPIDPVAEAVWEQAKRDICRHDLAFAAEHPVIASFGQPDTPETETT